MCNGKIIRETLAQMRSFSKWSYYFGGLADKIHGEVIPVEMDGMFSYTIREPLGVVAIIAPWNSPLLISVYSLAPALAAGNTVVLKPSSFAPISVLHFAALFADAGFPPGVVNVVTGSGSAAGTALVANRLVAKIVFTGGTSAGKDVAKRASEHLAQTTLELGGKSPNIVFDDAEIDQAVDGLMAGIYSAAGQSCVAGSRASHDVDLVLEHRQHHDVAVLDRDVLRLVFLDEEPVQVDGDALRGPGVRAVHEGQSQIREGGDAAGLHHDVTHPLAAGQLEALDDRRLALRLRLAALDGAVEGAAHLDHVLDAREGRHVERVAGPQRNVGGGAHGAQVERRRFLAAVGADTRDARGGARAQQVARSAARCDAARGEDHLVQPLGGEHLQRAGPLHLARDDDLERARRDHGDAHVRVAEDRARARGDRAIRLEKRQPRHPDRAERRQRDRALRIDDDLHASDVEPADDLHVEHIARTEAIIRPGDAARLLAEVQVAAAGGERREGARRARRLGCRRRLGHPRRRSPGCGLCDGERGCQETHNEGEADGFA